MQNYDYHHNPKNPIIPIVIITGVIGLLIILIILSNGICNIYITPKQENESLYHYYQGLKHYKNSNYRQAYHHYSNSYTINKKLKYSAYMAGYIQLHTFTNYPIALYYFEEAEKSKDIYLHNLTNYINYCRYKMINETVDKVNETCKKL